MVGRLPGWRQLGHQRHERPAAVARDQKLSKFAGQEVSSLASGESESGLIMIIVILISSNIITTCSEFFNGID